MCAVSVHAVLPGERDLMVGGRAVLAQQVPETVVVGLIIIPEECPRCFVVGILWKAVFCGVCVGRTGNLLFRGPDHTPDCFEHKVGVSDVVVERGDHKGRLREGFDPALEGQPVYAKHQQHRGAAHLTLVHAALLGHVHAARIGRGIGHRFEQRGAVRPAELPSDAKVLKCRDVAVHWVSDRDHKLELVLLLSRHLPGEKFTRSRP
mmetsp:Transcript_45342/g.147338  ORF Transcript_45342/g.147338 Transcript_45342/m.147338 type:complete len:206 (+) Transcript_45342:81-698(+)